MPEGTCEGVHGVMQQLPKLCLEFQQTGNPRCIDMLKRRGGAQKAKGEVKGKVLQCGKEAGCRYVVSALPLLAPSPVKKPGKVQS